MSGVHEVFAHDFDDITDKAAIALRVAQRAAYFIRTFEAWRPTIASCGLGCAYINKILLASAVESYFQDIGRLKAYHEMKFADRFKIAGYTIKWLTSVKPIQVPDIDPATSDGYRLIAVLNEGFAMISALHVAGGMSRAVLKFAQQALSVEQAMPPRPAVQDRG